MNSPVLRPIQAVPELGLSQTPKRFAFDAPPSELRLLVHGLSAGFPSPAGDYVEDALDLNQYLIQNKPATFLFTVRGDSMMGASIENGDKVVVDRALKPKHQDIIVAVVNGDYTIKRLYKYRGTIELRPENPNYPAITFTDGTELQVWGVVVGVVRKYSNKKAPHTEQRDVSHSG
jgi:DNA polymerase V